MEKGSAALGAEVMVELFGPEVAEALMVPFRGTGQAEQATDSWEEDVRGFAFGNVYSRGHLDLHTRALITIGVVTALGHLDILEAWLKASRNLGIPQEAVRESIIQSTIYGGFPNSRRALALAARVLGGSEQ